MCNRVKYKGYLCEYGGLADFVPDQTVIIKKKYLQYLPSLKYKDNPPEVPHNEEWYPFVNSYYPFTEDVDAFARVNHLLENKPSFASFSTLNSTDDINELIAYFEKGAQLQYLNSKPVCFLIVGKPGVGQEELGRRLADYWKCPYIDPQTLMEDEIQSGSRAGQCIEFNLRCGRAVGIDVILRLLAKKVQVPNVRHKGYVISGFPLIPNDLYEEDPISSESAVFNVMEIFDEIIENTLDLGDISKRQVSVSSRGRSEISSADRLSIDEDDTIGSASKLMEVEMSIGVSLHSDVCVPPEISTDFEKQINCLFGLFHDPSVIIYVNCGNSDVISKRDHYYFDIYSKKTCDMQKIKLFFDIGSADEDLTRDIFYADNNPLVENPDLKHVVKTPENIPAHVATQLDRYHSEVANLIDQRIMLHDVQYYIKVDGRALISLMLDVIKTRLRILPLQKVLLPEKFNMSFETEGEGAAPVETDDLLPEDAFQKLCRRQTASPSFKWTWSEWKDFCPVSMKEGLYKKGSSNYAVQFMSRIFFLADDAAYSKFCRDPRNYLMPPLPKPSCKIFIFGPPICGKTAVAKCIAYLLDGHILCPKKMLVKYVTNKENEFKEKARQSAIIEGVRILDDRRKNEFEAKKEERARLIEEWEASCRAVLKEVLFVLQKRSSTLGQISSFPMKLEKARGSIDELKEYFGPLLQEMNLPLISDLKECENFLKDKDVLRKYLPNALKIPIILEPASVFDPFVQAYAENKVDNLSYDDIKMTDEHILDMYVNTIKEIEEYNPGSGWIIDGMTTDINLLRQICSHIMADNVLILRDNPDHNFLLKRVEKRFQNDFRDFRKFFLNIGESDAAWRCPSTSTLSYKQEVAEEVLSDILKRGVSEEGIQEMHTATVEDYRKSLNKYDESLEGIPELFEEFNCRIVELNITGLSIEELMKEVINRLRNMFRESASPFTEQDRAEEVQEFLARTGGGGEGEGQDKSWKESFDKQRRYGNTYHYCPVTFYGNWVLWKGKEQFTVKFKNKIYLLSGEEDMKKFLEYPRQYLCLSKPPDKFPPPRICVVGVHGSGRTTLSKMLARNLGVRYFSYENFLMDQINSSGTTLSRSFADLRAARNDDDDWNSNESITDNFLQKMARELWFNEPIKSLGFVVDNFPKRLSDVEFMINNKAIPDCVIYLNCDQEKNHERLLRSSMENWRIKNEEQRKLQELIHAEVLKEWEENRKLRYNELMEIKRGERYASRIAQEVDKTETEDSPEDVNESGEELERKDFLSSTQISFDSIAEQQDNEEVTRILDEEFPEPTFSDNLETAEEAMERFNAMIEDNFLDEIKVLYEIKEACDIELIPWKEINANLDIERVAAQAYFVTEDVKFRNKSLFETCIDTSIEVAEKLLDKGYYFLSRFGKTCPVQYHEQINPIQMFLPMEQKYNLYPVIHRYYIYFITGSKNREKFIKDPLKYTQVRRCNFPLIPFRLAVIGPPKSGKTRLASRYQRDFGFKLLSRGQAARFTLRSLPFSDLAKSMETRLRKGEELTDQMTMASVHAASFDGHAITQGLVFDGFPNTISEMKVLSSCGLVPHLIMDLNATDAEVYKFSEIPPLPVFPVYSKRFVKRHLKYWKKTAAQFREWCDREYQTLYKLSVKQSIWGIWEASKEVALAVFSEISHYYKHIHHDWPLRVANMLVTPLEFLERQSNYKTYCPVCLKHSKSLKSGGDPPDRTGLVHFRNYFYWLCSDHIEEFLKVPEAFIPPYNALLPQNLPAIVKLDKMPENVYEDGFCTVCYHNGKPEKVMVKGDIKHAASYHNSIYLFDSEHCLNKFMSTPQNFCRETINFKTVPPYPSLDYDELPILGLLEQHVAAQLVKAIHHVNIHRPVIPGLSVSLSALIGIGLHLKAFNPKTPKEHRSLYEEALELFHQKRKDLTSFLDLMKTYRNPYLHYNEPDETSSDESSTTSEEIVETGSLEAPVSEESVTESCILNIIEDILEKINY